MFPIISVLAFCPLQAAPPAGPDLILSVERQRAELVRVFREPGFWGRAPGEVRAYLDAAALLRPVEIVPDLVEHIGYYDPADRHFAYRPMTPPERYLPAYRALRAYRDAAVPAVLDFLATPDGAEPSGPSSRTRASRCVWFLVFMNDQPYHAKTVEHGVEVARELIRKEAGRRFGVERERLVRLLEREFLLRTDR